MRHLPARRFDAQFLRQSDRYTASCRFAGPSVVSLTTAEIGGTALEPTRAPVPTEKFPVPAVKVRDSGQRGPYERVITLVAMPPVAAAKSSAWNPSPTNPATVGPLPTMSAPTAPASRSRFFATLTSGCRAATGPSRSLDSSDPARSTSPDLRASTSGSGSGPGGPPSSSHHR